MPKKKAPKVNKIYFELQNDIELPIKCDLRISENGESKPIVIISHGFKGFRNWGFIPYLSEVIAKSGAIAINIDFSMNGILDETKSFYDNDNFSNNTVSRQVADLKQTITYLKSKLIPELNSIYSNWNGELHLIGHSLGGATSLIVSNEISGISSLTLLASISNIMRTTPRQVNVWKEKGFIEVSVASGQKLQQNYSYWEDKLANEERFDLLKIISSTTLPVNIIHGLQDITVPFKEAEALLAAAINSPKRNLKPILHCNHVFNTRHPFDDTSNQLLEVIDSTVKFLNLYN